MTATSPVKQASVRTKDISEIVASAMDQPENNENWSDFIFQILGKASSRRTAHVSKRQVLTKYLKAGIKPESISNLSEYLHINKKDAYFYLSIPPTTYQRRVQEGKLKADESDRVYRYARLFSLAVDMMQGDQEAASDWFKTPQTLLNDESPLEHATTELGAREVDDLIGRIRHGVFS